AFASAVPGARALENSHSLRRCSAECEPPRPRSGLLTVAKKRHCRTHGEAADAPPPAALEWVSDVRVRLLAAELRPAEQRVPEQIPPIWASLPRLGRSCDTMADRASPCTRRPQLPPPSPCAPRARRPHRPPELPPRRPPAPT